MPFSGKCFHHRETKYYSLGVTSAVSKNTEVAPASRKGGKEEKKSGRAGQSGATGISKWVPATNVSNYILCHVRRVSGKSTGEGEDDDEGAEDNNLHLDKQRSS